jgi:hypothetical protein
MQALKAHMKDLRELIAKYHLKQLSSLNSTHLDDKSILQSDYTI